MSKLIIYILFFSISFNAYCWNPFENSKKTKEVPLTANELSALRIDLTSGEGNNLKVKVYNGLQGTVTCDDFIFYEKNGNQYTVSNYVTLPPQSIQNFSVKAFDLSKTKSGNLSGCKCDKLNNGKGFCTQYSD